MQAVFILGFFGTVYAIILAFTISLSQSAMQEKLQRIEDTKQIFKDVEYAVSEGLLEENADAESSNCATERFKFAQGYVKWTVDQLQVDPWGRDFACYTYALDTVLYADSNSNSVRAPVRVFALLSMGPDRALDTTPPTDYSSASTLEGADDDIVYVFSTYDKMLGMWEDVRQKMTKVSAVLMEDYQQQLRLFQPDIDDFYDTYGATLLQTYSDAAVVSNRWRVDLHPVTGTITPTGTYPRMNENLDLGDELDDMPAMVAADAIITMDTNDYGAATVAVDPLAGSNWAVSYSIDVSATEEN